jgi:hypothetical protein
MEQMVKLYKKSHFGRRLPYNDGCNSLYIVQAELCLAYLPLIPRSIRMGFYPRCPICRPIITSVEEPMDQRFSCWDELGFLSSSSLWQEHPGHSGLVESISKVPFGQEATLV